MKKIAVMAFATLLSACSMLAPQPISGTYKGTLPCADCEKIDAVLVLSQDNTYEYHTVYFKRGEQTPFSEKGKFSRHPNKSNVITLAMLNDVPPLTLKINADSAEFCDAKGNTVKGKEYKLRKTE